MSGFDQFLDFTKRELNMPDSLLKSFESNLRKEFGGDQIRIPKKQKDERNQSIISDYNGHNVKQLAIRYDLSESAIHKILNSRYE